MSEKNIRDFIRGATERLTAAGVDSPRLSAELILARTLVTRSEYLGTHPEQILNTAEAARTEKMLARRALGEPIAYILGKKEFYGREFLVNAETLIPRPETELLVELALKEHWPGETPGLVVDLGVGSGCILLTLLAERPSWQGLGADIAVGTLTMARKNACRLNLAERCTFMLADMTLPVFKKHSLALLLSNPPYIAPEDYAGLSHEVAAYEPRGALLSPEGGLAHLAALEAQGRECLAPGGVLLLEIGCEQGQSAMRLFERVPAFWTEVELHRDLAGLPRAIRAQRVSVC